MSKSDGCMCKFVQYVWLDTTEEEAKSFVLDHIKNN